VTARQQERLQRRDLALQAWASEHVIELDRLDEGQRWVVFAGLRGREVVGTFSPLRRALSFFLAKADMGLTDPVIAAVVGVSDRAVRVTKTMEAGQLLDSIAQVVRGHRQPKLRAEHAGIVARLLVDNPQVEAPEMIQALEAEVGVTVERHTLARYIEHYGLGCLRERTVEDRPLFWGTPLTEAPSS